MKRKGMQTPQTLRFDRRSQHPPDLHACTDISVICADAEALHHYLSGSCSLVTGSMVHEDIDQIQLTCEGESQGAHCQSDIRKAAQGSHLKLVARLTFHRDQNCNLLVLYCSDKIKSQASSRSQHGLKYLNIMLMQLVRTVFPLLLEGLSIPSGRLRCMRCLVHSMTTCILQ